MPLLFPLKHPQLTESDITSVCLDDRQRKFIAGEANGSVRVYNYANGAVMKSMVSHTREVSKLLYCNELKVVISCSWDLDPSFQQEET